jgi:hypothetical protein
MNINDLYDSKKLSEQIALEHYQQLNGVVDYRLPGVCNHYFATYDLSGQQGGEVCLTCKVSKTVKGSLRYTWQINGKRIAEKQIPAEFNLLGVFAH